MSTTSQRCTDPTVLDLWHPVASHAELVPGRTYSTLLLGHEILYGTGAAGLSFVARSDRPDVTMPALVKYGYVWTSLGHPSGDVFDIPEARECDRRSLNAASIQVATSAPRAVENFLDMAHFPYAHAGLLGEEPYTEVVDYEAQLENNEIWARKCRFHQPVAAPSATGSQMTEYTYRVPHPYCVMLYKSAPTDPSRRDVIALFIQAMTDQTIRAHNYLCVVDNTSTDTALKEFQQIIFAQDKPILENQVPRRLPLDPRVETPIRADRSAIMYRRWLTDLGVSYAVIRPD